MPSLIERRDRGEVAVLALASPPFNGLGHALRIELLAQLQQAVADPAVRGIVITGSATAFCAGADINEFRAGLAGAAFHAPTLPDIIIALEASPKPVAAAISGYCLGGGLELALGCHFRLAAAGASLGLPEVSLGILAGAGGTQRLPRAIGPREALRLMLAGARVDTDEAARRGLVEKIDGDVVAAACERVLAATGGTPPRLRDVRVDTAEAHAAADAAANAILATAVLRPAERCIIESVRSTGLLPIDVALAADWDYFKELMVTDEAKLLQAAFFAERAARRSIKGGE